MSAIVRTGHHTSGADRRLAAWTLEGWRPSEWQLAASVESGSTFRPEIGPLDARVPGDVRTTLVEHGVLTDPHVGVDSRLSEFVEHRHWIYRTRLRASLGDEMPDEIDITFMSVDGPCLIRYAGVVIAEHDNTHLPLRVRVRTGGDDVLEVILLAQPDGLGQVGRTEEILPTKPRFYYQWDWMPRLVQVGVPGGVSVAPAERRWVALRDVSARSQARRGVLSGIVDGSPELAGADGELLLRAGGVEHRKACRVGEPFEFTFDDVDQWTTERPTLHDLEYSVRAGDGAGLTSDVLAVGFVDREWRHRASETSGEPWQLFESGRRTPVLGVNWVPIRAGFASVSDAEYVTRLETYKALGFTLIRVWGGATIERDVFYETCDRLGLLVWQDLPVSSSGLNNTPPASPEMADLLERIAIDWRGRIGHHPSLAVWCGGNELTTHASALDLPGTPVLRSHPGLSRALEALEADPRWKTVPATPSGPCFGCEVIDTSGHEHHDVHGPWVINMPADDWGSLWQRDTARIRTEVGVAGASSRDLLEAYGLWGDVATWSHSSSWWLDGTERLTDDWIEESQARQADYLATAFRAVLSRADSHGGIIVWLGHDAFPCAVSLSLLDFWGRPKPAALAIAAAIASGIPAVRG